MSLANPRWGAPRLHAELLKLGFDLSEATVAKIHGTRPEAALTDLADVVPIENSVLIEGIDLIDSGL